MRHWLAGWHSISDDIQSFRTETASISHIRGSLIHFRLLIAASSTPHVTQNNWQIISATAQFPVFDFSRGLTDNLSLLLPISSASHSLSRLHRVINEVPFQMRSSLRQPQKDPLNTFLRRTIIPPFPFSCATVALWKPKTDSVTKNRRHNGAKEVDESLIDFLIS